MGFHLNEREARMAAKKPAKKSGATKRVAVKDLSTGGKGANPNRKADVKGGALQICGHELTHGVDLQKNTLSPRG